MWREEGLSFRVYESATDIANTNWRYSCNSLSQADDSEQHANLISHVQHEVSKLYLGCLHHFYLYEKKVPPHMSTQEHMSAAYM